jgi:dTDP-4-dehydrorhamnose 3,5-epimerase
MIFITTNLAGSFTVQPALYKDDRGWFTRVYCKNEFSQIASHKEWVQINHSFSANMGTVRGMHYQMPPYSEIKLVRCIAGSVYDVIIDLRKDSPTFLQWFGAELSAANKTMMYIPEGFAHGFQSLSNNVELIYHHSQFYTPGSERGVMYNDITVGIKWPLPITDISERDKIHPPIDSTFKAL